MRHFAFFFLKKNSPQNLLIKKKKNTYIKNTRGKVEIKRGGEQLKIMPHET